MTESTVVAIQVISAAGVFFLSALTLTGRFAKALREEMRAGHDALRAEMREDREMLREEMRAGHDALRAEMREDRAAIFGEIKELRLEMHDMNGRLGRVEGHMGISTSKSFEETQ